MEQKKKVEQQIIKIRDLNLDTRDLDNKLEELMTLLQSSDIDSESLANIQVRFNKAIEDKKELSKDLQRFQELKTTGVSRLDLANDLEAMLAHSQLNSENVKELEVKRGGSRLLTFLIGAVMITLGFAMIIMPAPPYFEMFTIFYFTPDDGVTLMDLVSLLIVLCGIYLVFTSSVKKTNA